MDPYRSAEPDALAQAPADQGIVGDVIAQFADPLAFYRELVQNAIDAGSPAIEVRLARAEEGKLVVAVIDRGEGMTREVIENQLLVLFRSTKETDATKIGKFGIGFASVLAPDPTLVRVTSARDGRRLELHLSRDLTYRLFDAGAATHAGTTVELELAMPAGEVRAFVERSRQALVRWCRHAVVPIELHVPGGERAERIDRPLGIDDALVSVEAREDDGQLAVIVGVCADRAARVAFFNHGLTLYETTDDLLGAGRVVVKIQDARLGHTLSRDDVRRDARYDRALEVARRLARERLPEVCATAVATAARGDVAEHGTLVDALTGAGIALPTWTFPLAVPFGEARTCELGGLRAIWASAQAGELARVASAELGVPILACVDRPTLEARVAAIVDKRVAMVERELTHVEPVEPDAQLAEILAELAAILARVHRAPRAIVPARLVGAHAGAFALAGSTRGRGLVDRDEAAASPFARLKRPPLAINVAHAYVVAARARPAAAGATLLARTLLLAHGALDVDRSTAVFADALGRLEVDA